MKGIIIAVNVQRGMVGVRTENGDFSIFEFLEGDWAEAGDEVAWEDDTSLGHTMLTNITQGLQFEVFFQNHWVPKHQLRKQLLME